MCGRAAGVDRSSGPRNPVGGFVSMPTARVLAVPIVTSSVLEDAIDANDRSALMLERAMSRLSVSGISNVVGRWVAAYRRRLWIQHMVVCCVFEW